jgi:hypothetical protein
MLLLIVGGINWGLVGVFQFDLVQALFGKWQIITRIIYSLVGVSAILALIGGIKMHGKYCDCCKKDGAECCDKK